MAVVQPPNFQRFDPGVYYRNTGAIIGDSIQSIGKGISDEQTRISSPEYIMAKKNLEKSQAGELSLEKAVDNAVEIETQDRRHRLFSTGQVQGFDTPDLAPEDHGPLRPDGFRGPKDTVRGPDGKVGKVSEVAKTNVPKGEGNFRRQRKAQLQNVFKTSGEIDQYILDRGDWLKENRDFRAYTGQTGEAIQVPPPAAFIRNKDGSSNALTELDETVEKWKANNKAKILQKRFQQYSQLDEVVNARKAKAEGQQPVGNADTAQHFIQWDINTNGTPTEGEDSEDDARFGNKTITMYKEASTLNLINNMFDKASTRTSQRQTQTQIDQKTADKAAKDKAKEDEETKKLEEKLSEKIYEQYLEAGKIIEKTQDNMTTLSTTIANQTIDKDALKTPAGADQLKKNQKRMKAFENQLTTQKLTKRLMLFHDMDHTKAIKLATRFSDVDVLKPSEIDLLMTAQPGIEILPDHKKDKGRGDSTGKSDERKSLFGGVVGSQAPSDVSSAPANPPAPKSSVQAQTGPTTLDKTSDQVTLADINALQLPDNAKVIINHKGTPTEYVVGWLKQNLK